VPTIGGCCNNGECTSGPSGTTGVCGSGGTCTYPCNTPTYKQCGAGCILSAACCTKADCGATQTCNAGVCVDIVCSSDQDCANATLYCAGTACRKHCAATSDCNQGEYCAATRCISQLPLGSGCTTGDQCGTGVCSTNVCCKAACGANQTCNGNGDCVCVGNTHTCSGLSGCYADSVQRCGTTCAPCSSVADGTSECLAGGQCDATCNTGYMRCDAQPRTCVTASWSFESGSLEGWQIFPTTNTSVDGSSISTTRAAPSAGTHALAIPATFNCTRRGFQVGISPCAFGISSNLLNKTFSFQVYFEGPAIVPDGPKEVTAGAGTTSGSLTSNAVTPVANQWLTVSLSLTDPSASSVNMLNANFFMVPTGPAPGFVCLQWQGTIYLDAFAVK